MIFEVRGYRYAVSWFGVPMQGYEVRGFRFVISRFRVFEVRGFGYGFSRFHVSGFHGFRGSGFPVRVDKVVVTGSCF